MSMKNNGGRYMKNYYAEDEQLIQSVRKLMAGDMDSYYDMYNLSIKYIYKIIYDIVKDYHATEDLVQDTYLTIYNKINTLQDPNKFYAWAGRIATNFTLRYVTNSKRELLTMDSEEGAENFMFDMATQDNEAFIPESILMDKEKQRLIAQIVDGLSVEQKLSVQYFYYEEMSVKDIAEAMNCSTGTVKSRLNYARNAIKSAVIALDENESTRLYSLSAVPLFVIIFRQAVAEFVFAGAAGVATAAVGASAMAGEGAVVGAMSAGAGEGMVVAGTNTGASAGGAVATKVGTGLLGKIGSSVAAKVVTGIVAAGVVTVGGVAIHHIVTEDKEPQPETVPMVIHMESEANVETVDIADDRFAYEYITVTYNDEEITMGFDGNIYQYGYDSYETLSPELMNIHEEEYPDAVAASEDELNNVFEETIKFTIDGEEFVFHVEDVKIEANEDGDGTYITLIGNCETPDNVEDIYAKYQTEYDETLAALESNNTTEVAVSTEEADGEEEPVQEERSPKEQAIYDYYMGVLMDMHLNRVDPFGNDLGTDMQSGSEICVTEYAIADVDMDDMSELIVRTNPSNEIVYGYNPDTGLLVEEAYIGSIDFRTTAEFTYYDTGFLCHEQTDEVFAYDANTDTYDTSKTVFNLASIDMLVYDYSPSSHLDPERQAKEQELLDQYDKDGDGLLWYERMEDGTNVFYDKPEYETRFNEVIQGGNKIEVEYLDINTIMSKMDEDEVRNNYYLSVVKDMYLYQKDPHEYGYLGKKQGDWKEIYEYTIYDVDCDGIEELIVRYGSGVYTYEYDTVTGEVKWEFGNYIDSRGLISIQFYENGLIVMDSYDGGRRVEKYNKDSGVYDIALQYLASGTEAWPGTGEYPNDEPVALHDKDGDGVAYVEIMNDGSVVYRDNAEMDARIASVFGGAQELNLEFIDMSTVVE